MSIDKTKYDYFLAKYRALDSDELRDLASRGGNLVEEAQLALQEVCSPSGITVERASPEVTSKRPTTPEEIEADKTLSSALWNGSLSKRVEYLFVAQALMFSFAFLGPQGLKAGALPLVVLAATLSFIARKAGRAFTRRMCADAEVSIENKTSNLKVASYILWPALLLSSLLGVTCANMIR
jgi:hypothetical protein